MFGCGSAFARRKSRIICIKEVINMHQKPRWICLLLAALLLAFLCSGCKSAQTLETLQQQAYEAIEEEDAQKAYEIVLEAEAQFPGELDSALYQLLLDQAGGDFEQEHVLAVYETLGRRGELELAQMLELGQYYQAQGKLRQARDLYELSLRRENSEEIYSLLQSMTISFDQESEQLQAYLRQAGSAAREERMPELIGLLQSAEWLNAAMPSNGNGGRFYETEEDGTRIRIAAELSGGKPVTSIWVLTQDGKETSIRVSPEAVALVRGEVREGAYQGAVSAEILEISAGMFYRIDGTLQNNLFSGQANFQLFSVAAQDTAAARWEHRQDTAAGAFSGAFSEDGHPQAQQQGGADSVVVGYDGSNEKYLALRIPEGASAQDGISIFWMPAAKAWEGK